MNIDRFAGWYRWTEYAAFGAALERRRFAFLNRLDDARRVLILGEGDGRALERLLVLAPRAEIDVIELSGKMIALACKRVRDPNRVHFLQQDALTISWPTEHYDGVMTLFFLDCFHEAELRVLTRDLAGAMRPNAIWLVSDFAIPDRGWHRWHAQVWIWFMYRFFGMASGLRIRTLPPIQKILTDAGMRPVESEDERAGLIRSEIWVRASRPSS